MSQWVSTIWRACHALFLHELKGYRYFLFFWCHDPPWTPQTLSGSGCLVRPVSGESKRTGNPGNLETRYWKFVPNPNWLRWIQRNLRLSRSDGDFAMVAAAFAKAAAIFAAAFAAHGARLQPGHAARPCCEASRAWHRERRHGQPSATGHTAERRGLRRYLLPGWSNHLCDPFVDPYRDSYIAYDYLAHLLTENLPLVLWSQIESVDKQAQTRWWSNSF